VAEAGPWTEKPTVFEFYVLPEWRGHAFDLIEAFLTTGSPSCFEVQTSDSLLTVMLLTYGCTFVTESIVFRDDLTALLPSQGATLKRITSEKESQRCFEACAGHSEWQIEWESAIVGRALDCSAEMPWILVTRGMPLALSRLLK